MIALSAAMNACGDGASRSGFPDPAVSLTLGIADQPGRFSFDLARDFADRVERATGGAVVVTPVAAPDTTERRYNQLLANAVVEGAYDLGLVQAHAWDALGVDSLSALYVPLLVDSDDLVDEIATGPIAADLLAGLTGAGVEPLALMPGGLRHVVGVHAPFDSLPDFDGAGLRVPYSEATWAIFEALGARPDDPNSTDVEAALRSGELTGFDSMFRLADAFVDAAAIAADITPYPHAFTLVAHPAALGGLDSRTRKQLRQAAFDTASWSADTRPPDAAEAAALCARAPGVTVTLAGHEAIAEIERAVAPFARELRTDPLVDDLATRIEVLKAKLPKPPPTAPCEGPSLPGPPATAGTNVPPSFPEGVYRRQITEESLLEAGIDPSTAVDHAGLATLTFRAGRFEDPGCPGSTYRIDGARLEVLLGAEGESCGSAAGKVLFTSGWLLDGESMTFTDVRTGHGSDLLVMTLFGGGPWTKID